MKNSDITLIKVIKMDFFLAFEFWVNPLKKRNKE